MTKIYFASPLFSEMELAFNKVLVEKIRHQFPGVEVYKWRLTTRVLMQTQR